MGFDSAGFKKDMRALGREIKAAVAPAMDKASNVLAEEIRRQAPVDTGKLKASVVVKKVRVTSKAVVQDVTVSGGHEGGMVGAVEYGTKFESPDPFIRRSAAAKEDEMVRIIEDAILGD